MDSSAGKRQKHCDVTDEDRISNLPDSVVCHILSFLPTKSSIQTSMLSRRWRFMWTSVPVLDLCDMSFEYLRKKRRTKFYWAKSFKEFVDRVLALRSNPRIQILRLNVFNPVIASQVASYISPAISQNVEVIDLSILGDKVRLPQILFNCGTLSVLKIRYSAIELDVAESVSMPNLKVFHIHLAYRLCAVTMNKLLRGCPILEELVIHSCSNIMNSNFALVSSTLKTLKIIQNSGVCCDNNWVVIDAPKLELLDVRGYGFNVELKNTPSILEATIISTRSCRSRGIQKITGNLWTMVNVKVLHLSMYALKDPLVYELIHFANLKKLLLKCYGEDDLSILPQILKRLPCLEHLILEKENHHTMTWKGLELEKSEINCLKYSLKRLELGGFSCHMGEMELLKYFIQNSSVLNEIRLNRFSSQREVSFLKKLLTFPRCSNAFRIIFS